MAGITYALLLRSLRAVLRDRGRLAVGVLAGPILLVLTAPVAEAGYPLRICATSVALVASSIGAGMVIGCAAMRDRATGFAHALILSRHGGIGAALAVPLSAAVIGAVSAAVAYGLSPLVRQPVALANLLPACAWVGLSAACVASVAAATGWSARVSGSEWGCGILALLMLGLSGALVPYPILTSPLRALCWLNPMWYASGPLSTVCGVLGPSVSEPVAGAVLSALVTASTAWLIRLSSTLAPIA